MATGFRSHCALLLWLLWMLAHLAGASDSETDTIVVSTSNVVQRPCLDSDDAMNEARRCLGNMTTFLRRYLRRLEKDKHYDTCGNFHAVDACMQQVMTSCSDVTAQYAHMLTPVLDFLRCSCSGDTQCQWERDCFQGEVDGPLYRRCTDLYEFNLRQRTHPQCYFLTEQLNCKAALVRTACTERAADFSFRAMQFMAHTEHSECQLTPSANYTGFRYHADCPPVFVTDMKHCEYRHLSTGRLQFERDNDLVAMGTRHDIKSACRRFRSYKMCMRPIRKPCSDGTRIMYGYEPDIRKYELKMDFLCTKQHKRDYARHLYCYQDVLHNRTLTQCDDIWADLKPLVHTVSSYHFYCAHHHHGALSMKLHLDRLRTCYVSHFRSSCGADAASMMGHMIKTAFQDPAYLRYDFKADCRLHRKQTRRKPEWPEPTLVYIEDLFTLPDPTNQPQRRALSAASLVSQSLPFFWFSFGSIALHSFLSYSRLTHHML